MSEPLTPKQRSQRAKIAADARWARESDPAKAVRPAVEATLLKFEREVDPDGVLPTVERRARAERLRRSHMRSLALKSSRARQAKRGAVGGSR